MAAVDVVKTPEVTPRAVLAHSDSSPLDTPQPTIAGSGPKDTTPAVGESDTKAPATAVGDSHATACAREEIVEAISLTPGATNSEVGAAGLTAESQGKKVRAGRGKRQTTKVEPSAKIAHPTERPGKEMGGAGDSSTAMHLTEENPMRRPQRVRTASSRARQEDP